MSFTINILWKNESFHYLRPRLQAQLQSERARLRALVKQQLAELAAVTEADEGRSLAGKGSSKTGAARGAGKAAEKWAAQQREAEDEEIDEFFLPSDTGDSDINSGGGGGGGSGRGDAPSGGDAADSDSSDDARKENKARAAAAPKPIHQAPISMQHPKQPTTPTKAAAAAAAGPLHQRSTAKAATADAAVKAAGISKSGQQKSVKNPSQPAIRVGAAGQPPKSRSNDIAALLKLPRGNAGADSDDTDDFFMHSDDNNAASGSDLSFEAPGSRGGGSDSAESDPHSAASSSDSEPDPTEDDHSMRLKTGFSPGVSVRDRKGASGDRNGVKPLQQQPGRFGKDGRGKPGDASRSGRQLENSKAKRPWPQGSAGSRGDERPAKQYRQHESPAGSKLQHNIGNKPFHKADNRSNGRASSSHQKSSHKPWHQQRPNFSFGGKYGGEGQQAAAANGASRSPGGRFAAGGGAAGGSSALAGGQQSKDRPSSGGGKPQPPAVAGKANGKSDEKLPVRSRAEGGRKRRK